MAFSHALWQVTKAVTLINQAQERRPAAVRERPELLRGLPRSAQEHRADQVGRVLAKTLRQRYEQPPSRLDPLMHVRGARLAEHVAQHPFPSSARSLFDYGASACTRAGSLNACHWRQNTSSATGSLAR